MKALHADAVIIGHTLAGWMAAHTLLKQIHGRVLLIQEADPGFFHTPVLIQYPHGAYSADACYQDMRRMGCGQNDPDLLHVLCAESAQAVQALESRGILLQPVDERRSALSGDLFRALVPREVFHASWAGLRLCVSEGRVQGVLCADLETGEFFLISAGTVLLAGSGYTPGCGTLAMAYYAGASLADLEFACKDGDDCRLCGGAIIDAWGRTHVRGLLAAGGAVSGIQGAAWHAGIAGAADLVFGRRAGQAMAESGLPAGGADEALLAWAEENYPLTDVPVQSSPDASLRRILEEAQDVQRHLAGAPDQGTLEQALQTASHLQHELNELPPACPAETIRRLTAEQILVYLRLHLLASLERRDSVGCFQRADFPSAPRKPYRIRMGLQGMILFPEKEDWSQKGEGV